MGFEFVKQIIIYCSGVNGVNLYNYKCHAEFSTVHVNTALSSRLSRYKVETVL